MLTLKFSVKPSRMRALTALSAIAFLPLLLGCDTADSSKTIGQKLDSAVAKTEQAAADVKDATKASVASASVALRDGADQARTAARNTADSVTVGGEDAAITASVAAGLIKDPDLSVIKIDIDTKQGVVSLYGPAPSEAARMRATDIAKAVKGVSSVDNKLTVKTS